MRILFSSVTAAGHLLPLVPLADVAAGAGHDVAFLTGAELAGYVGRRALVPAGPSPAELLAESQRRTGGGDARHPGEAAVAHFTDTRIDLTYDEALDQARRFAPDLLVCEALDFAGPLVAAALGVPWAAHAITAPMPGRLYETMLTRAEAQHAARGPTAAAAGRRAGRPAARRASPALRPAAASGQAPSAPGGVHRGPPLSREAPRFRSNGRWC